MKLSETNIMLIGFMGVGKTTVSKALSNLTQMPEVDMDAYIVEHEKRSIADIFATDGEAYFRTVETECLKEILITKNQIVSCGGGVAMKEENVALMQRDGVIVLLSATPETIYHRVKDTTNRPLLNGNMNIPYIQNLMEKRRPKYEAAAEITVATDGKTAKAIAEEIIEKIEEIDKK